MSVILRTNQLTKRYAHRTVVDHLSMTIHEGDIYGFIGKNGAGKTTLIRMITGLAAPDDGTILMFGSPDLPEGRKFTGTVIESPALYPGMTAKENLLAQYKLQGIRNESQADSILTLVGLDDAGTKKAKDFSLGMRQRLAIGIALIGNPKFLILDEPTNGLDPEGIKEIRDLILRLNHDRKITVLISSHILGELSKFATRYGIIHQGKLIDEFTEEQLIQRCSAQDGTPIMDLEDYFLKKIQGGI